jgi:hypothetical protein
MTRQLFETTLYSEDDDVALAVVSVPTEYLPDRSLASSPAEVLAALRLRPVAEVPSSNVADALAAVLATRTATDAAQWLAEPPEAVPTALGDDLAVFAEALISDRRIPERQALYEPPERRLRPPRPPQEVPKADPRARELRQFAEGAAVDAVVPFQRSPIDLYQLPDLFQLAGASRVLLTTVQSSPLVMVWVAGGFLIFSAIRGAGRGISAGLKYRLLRLFGLPEDIIREQMRRRPRR